MCSGKEGERSGVLVSVTAMETKSHEWSALLIETTEMHVLQFRLSRYGQIQYLEMPPPT